MFPGGPRIGGISYHLDALELVGIFGLAVEVSKHPASCAGYPAPVMAGGPIMLARYTGALVVGAGTLAGSERDTILAAALARGDDVFLSLFTDPLEGSALFAVEG